MTAFDDSAKQFAEKWRACYANNGTCVEFAKEMGTSERALYARRKRVEKHLGIELPTMVGSAVSAARVRARSALKGWAPEHDMTHEVPDPFTVKGVSTLYVTDEEGKTSVKAQWVKSTQDAAAREEMLQAAVVAFTEELPKLSPRKAKGKYLPDLHTVYPMGDPHIGQNSWAEECGQSWDLSIAERVHCSVVDALVDGAPASESATIIDLGDAFHYDSIAAVTPRGGNNLDVDGRYAKVISVGIKIMRRCIESALAKHKRVHIICVPGNHDETGGLWLSAALAHIYEREPRITVETQPSLFAYFEFGKNLVGVHHGHTVKMKDLPPVMAADRPEAWGRAKHRFWLTGHIHHQQILELPGCVVESFNTLAPNDAYATSGGWRSRENMKAIVLHREFGEVARHTVNPQMVL